MSRLSRSLKTRRPGKRRPSWLRRVLRPRHLLWAGLLGAAAAGVTEGVLAWRAGWFGEKWNDGVTAVLDATASAGLSVNSILVDGRHETGADEIMAALEIGPGDPILGLDVDGARDRLEALPWVRAVHIERRLPDTVYVRLTERLPIAVWQKDGVKRLIDSDGAVVSEREADLARFARLPLVVGPDAPEHAAQFLALLRGEPDIAAKVTAASRIGERRWDLTFTSGAVARLPEEDPGAALARLAELEREEGILESSVSAIDLRVPDRAVARLEDGIDRARRFRAMNRPLPEKPGEDM
jgi:cell division protein FtsQ